MENYKKFMETYKSLLKKYTGLANLYGFRGEITMEETRYKKRGARWIQTEQSTETVSPARLLNTFDAVPVFRMLGGYERVTCGYTPVGYIPVESASISPDKADKVVRKFKIEVRK